jgi:hypothetical protein
MKGKNSMNKINIGIEYHNQQDINVFEKNLRKLIKEKNILESELVDELTLQELTKKVVIIYLPDSDYKKLVEHINSTNAKSHSAA